MQVEESVPERDRVKGVPFPELRVVDHVPVDVPPNHGQGRPSYLNVGGKTRAARVRLYLSGGAATLCPLIVWRVNSTDILSKGTVPAHNAVKHTRRRRASLAVMKCGGTMEALVEGAGTVATY